MPSIEEGRVIVVGAGPAGAVCAARLAQLGRDVVLVDKSEFPRFAIGESLLPGSIPILSALGVTGELEARGFVVKRGARFVDERGLREAAFTFENSWRPDPPSAFQVERDAFDAILVDRARALGATVLEGRAVVSVMANDGGARVVLASPSDERVELHASFVVDASGRSAVMGRARGLVEPLEGLDQHAFYGHFDGVPRAEGDRAGDTLIVLFDGSGSGGAQPSWFWFIPLREGRTSVGVVASRGWIRETRAALQRAGVAATSDAFFTCAVRASKTAEALLDRAELVWPHVRATSDFSFGLRERFGARWAAVGDAAGFIDPLFSTGVHLAIHGAFRLADAVAATSSAPLAERLVAWDAESERAASTFRDAVRAFYEGPLVDFLFTPDQHVALRRSVTSLLAGDVFHDGVWLRDARRRVREMTKAGAAIAIAAPATGALEEGPSVSDPAQASF